MDPERIGHVEENTALTTDVLLVRAGASGGGSPALGLGVSPQPDVTVLAPSGAPGVPHDPVISQAGVSAVSDQLDGVVQGNVGVVAAAVVDAATVTSPA